MWAPDAVIAQCFTFLELMDHIAFGRCSQWLHRISILRSSTPTNGCYSVLNSPHRFQRINALGRYRPVELNLDFPSSGSVQTMSLLGNMPSLRRLRLHHPTTALQTLTQLTSLEVFFPFEAKREIAALAFLVQLETLWCDGLYATQLKYVPPSVRTLTAASVAWCTFEPEASCFRDFMARVPVTALGLDPFWVTTKPSLEVLFGFTSLTSLELRNIVHGAQIHISMFEGLCAPPTLRSFSVAAHPESLPLVVAAVPFVQHLHFEWMVCALNHSSLAALLNLTLLKTLSLKGQMDLECECTSMALAKLHQPLRSLSLDHAHEMSDVAFRALLPLTGLTHLSIHSTEDRWPPPVRGALRGDLRVQSPDLRAIFPFLSALLLDGKHRHILASFPTETHCEVWDRRLRRYRTMEKKKKRNC